MMGSSKQTTTEHKDPWAPTVDPMKRVIADTESLGTADRFKQTYSQQSNDGLSLWEKMARDPSQGQQAANANSRVIGEGMGTGINQLMASANGQNLMGNPFLRQSVSNQMDDVQERIQGQFAGSGRLGSGANQRVLADRLGRLGTEAAQKNYDMERGYQTQAANTLFGGGMQGMQMAPGLDQARMFGAHNLMGVGAMHDARAQNERMAPLHALDYRRSGILPMGGMGSDSTSTQTTKANPTSQIMGGLMMAGQMAMGMPPGMGMGMGGGGGGGIGSMMKLPGNFFGNM
jgi:hypothetical protein